MANLDPEGAFRSLENRTKEAIQSHFPVKGKVHRLELVRLWTESDDSSREGRHHIDNLTQQREAKLQDRTWGPLIRGEFKLIEISSGKIIDTKVKTLAQLPKITRRYSYIVDGNERQVDGVFRLNPGAYHAEADNGDLLAKWNVAAGSKIGAFDLAIERRDGKRLGLIRMKVKSGDSSTRLIPIYGILLALNVPESSIRSALGEKVFEINRKAYKPQDLLDFHQAVAGRRDKKNYQAPSLQEARQYIRDIFANAEVNPETMLSSVGKKFSNISGEALTLSARKLVKISKGEAEEDDRQSLSNKRLFGIEDFVHESLTKRNKVYELQRKIRNNLDRKDRIDDIIPAPSSGYGKAISSVFKQAQLPTQTNPLQFISNHTRTTILGQAFGGIKGDNINLDRDKLINPSHLGLLDPLQTPENQATGVALHVPLGSKKIGHSLRARVIDIKTGKPVYKSSAELERAVVAYPDQVKLTKNSNGTFKVTPLAKEVVVYDSDRSTAKRSWNEVQYVLPSAKHLFSVSANMIPFVQNNNGNRAMMAAKHQEQAVGLTNREEPLVQSLASGSTSFEKMMGTFSSTISDIEGKVSKVTEEGIWVKPKQGKTIKHSIYNYHPLNGSKHMMHSTPKVKVGDQVKKGQLLADSNFTNKGSLALGTNLRVAYVPYKGYNFEDGIVISQSASEKLVSSHLHVESALMTPNVVVNKKLWRAYAGLNKATAETLNSLDEDGIIKKGTKVQPGDVLLALLQKSDPSRESRNIQKSLKKAIRDYTDRSLIWNHEYGGEVVRIVKNRRKISIYIKTNQTMEVGDKLSGRHGNKGIITKILPDDEMPKDKSGNPVQVLLSPAGVPSRMNVGQLLETTAAKIAKKTGKPYVVENFDSTVDYTKKVQDDLKKHGISDTEELFDAETGKSLGQILVGPQYMLKLDHQAEKKVSARSGGFGYAYKPSGEAISGSGIGKGGQKIGSLDSYALLAHGASHNLREMQTYKSDQDQAETVWLRIMEGGRPPTPKVPRSMDHFKRYLRGLGVYTEEKAGVYGLSPMTDKQIVAQSNGKLSMPEKTLLAKGALTKEEKGGLFDFKKTGGIDGQYWTHVDLGTRLPNPVFEGPIQSLIGVTKKEYEKLVSGEDPKGFQKIEEKLSSINVNKELKEATSKLKTAKKNELNKLYKRVRYLKALKDLNISPVDAYTNKMLPVLPPKLRKISIGYDGTQIIDPLNQLYAAVGQMTTELAAAKKVGRGGKDLANVEAKLYDAVRALRMTGAQIEGKQYPSLMDKLTGTKPKNSFFQEGVLGKRQDLSGRSVITPEPKLSMDEVGVPTPIAMEVYKPFVIRELWRRMGRASSAGQARKMIKQNHPSATEALERVIKDRPVLLKRDPTLHKFGIMAFKPKLVTGKSIKVHPLIVGGFNADFDGDTMGLFVPISEKAKDEALHKMLPSKSLFSPTHGGIMVTPSQDGILGLYHATKWGKRAAGVFTKEQALAQMKSGKLKSSSVIKIKGMDKLTTPGRLALNDSLPPEFKGDAKILHDSSYRMSKKPMKALATDIARSNPEAFSRMIDKWKELGFYQAYSNGSSFSLKDFHDGKEIRDQILRPYKKKEAEIRRSKKSRATKDKEIITLYQKARQELQSVGEARYNRLDNNKMWEWAQSGAKSDWNQFSQLVMGPILVQDPKKRTVPVPLTKSFGEGLPVSQYWASLHGARKGTLDRAAGTKDPGALTKELINTVIGQSIDKKDCGTTRGSLLNTNVSDIEGRYLAKDVELKGGDKILRGTLITTNLHTRLKNSGPQKVLVRSPLHCQVSNGICATCYGLSERGKPYEVGTNIGIIAGHALGEPVTQMQMRTFHTGGAGSSAVDDYYARAKDLFKVPKKLRGQATLSTVSGTVQKITPDALGGKVVRIDNKDHIVPHTNELLPSVRVGTQIRKAEALSTGRKNPHEILKITNSISAVRNHITSELGKLYMDSTGIGRRRNVEVVVRAMTDVTSVGNNSEDEGLLRGQLTSLSALENRNKELKMLGLPEVKHTPVLKSLDKVPLSGQEDWMARLNFQRLKDTFVEGTAQNWKSDINGHPIPGLAHGAEFGVDKTPTLTTSALKVNLPEIKKNPSFSFFGKGQ